MKSKEFHDDVLFNRKWPPNVSILRRRRLSREIARRSSELDAVLARRPCSRVVVVVVVGRINPR